MRILAQEFHDIAPPVDYSLIPIWLIIVAGGIALLFLGMAGWYARKFSRRKQPPRSPRDRTLTALDVMEREVDKIPPYQFSIRLSDILRRYVLEQFSLPMTRQTSVEFLNAIASAANFTADEKALLADFLHRCDLIKFARYQATVEDSRRLLEEAREFVKGETLVHA